MIEERGDLQNQGQGGGPDTPGWCVSPLLLAVWRLSADCSPALIRPVARQEARPPTWGLPISPGEGPFRTEDTSINQFCGDDLFVPVIRQTGWGILWLR